MIQAGLFVLALCIVTLDPSAERSLSTVQAEEACNHVSVVMASLEIFTEPPDALGSLMPDETPLALVLADSPNWFLPPIAHDRAHHQTLHAHLVASICCTSDL